MIGTKGIGRKFVALIIIILVTSMVSAMDP